MDMPKSVKDYCVKCKSHTQHKLKAFKAGATRTMSRGQRRNIQKKKGYGGKYQFPAIIKKQNKRPTFMAECTVCGRKHYIVIQKRMAKVELSG